MYWYFEHFCETVQVERAIKKNGGCYVTLRERLIYFWKGVTGCCLPFPVIEWLNLHSTGEGGWPHVYSQPPPPWTSPNTTWTIPSFVMYTHPLGRWTGPSNVKRQVRRVAERESSTGCSCAIRVARAGVVNSWRSNVVCVAQRMCGPRVKIVLLSIGSHPGSHTLIQSSRFTTLAECLKYCISFVLAILSALPDCAYYVSRDHKRVTESAHHCVASVCVCVCVCVCVWERERERDRERETQREISHTFEEKTKHAIV